MSVEAAFSTNRPPFVRLSLTFAPTTVASIGAASSATRQLHKPENKTKKKATGAFLSGKAVLHSLTPAGEAGANA